MRMRTVAALATVLGSSVLVACGDDDGGPLNPTDLYGQYALQTIDGEPLPFAVQQPPGAEILSGAVTLQLESGYDLFLAYRDKVGEETYDETGTWGLFAGDSIFFRPDGTAPLYRGRIANGVITAVAPDGLLLRFAR